LNEVANFVMCLGGGNAKWIEDLGLSEGVVIGVGAGLTMGVYCCFNSIVVVVSLMTGTMSDRVVSIG
jgi:hypothetical protein